MKLVSTLSVFFFVASIQAHQIDFQPQTVLTDSASARAVGGIILSEDKDLGVAVTTLTAAQISQLSRLGHAQNKCAGFETLTSAEAAQPEKVLRELNTSHRKLSRINGVLAPQLTYNSNYQSLINQASSHELKKTVTWLSSYLNRYHASATPNKHVDDLKLKLQTWLKNAPWAYTLDLITHKTTAQKSLRLRVTGTKRPNEIVVLGAHLDSVNHPPQPPWPMPPIPPDPKASAPGADDNASGSSNLIEALKILMQVKSFDRTLEFYWYAGEEAGLLGSKDIAATAKKAKKNIIGALQLDMTLFSGSGSQVLGSMTDFTSPWLRGVFYEMNDLYIKYRVIEDECGYGCSDHASWHKNGYPAIMPFEATFNKSNHLIHSTLDVVDSRLNFDHSNTFTKYAILFATTLGNSTVQSP